MIDINTVSDMVAPSMVFKGYMADVKDPEDGDVVIGDNDEVYVYYDTKWNIVGDMPLNDDNNISDHTRYRLTISKCPHCHGSLHPKNIDHHNGVVRCEYCNSYIPLLKEEENEYAY